jgi:hypothetical protein
MQPLDPYSYSLSGTLSHNWERGKGCEGDDRGFPASRGTRSLATRLPLFRQLEAP